MFEKKLRDITSLDEFDKDAIENLAKTIHGHKIINPIEIDKDNVIITGELRWRALMHEGVEKTLVKRITEISENKRFERQMIENIHHNILKDGEFVKGILKLWKSKEYNEPKDLAKTIGQDRTYIEGIIGLPKIEEKIGKNVAKQLKTTTKIEIVGEIIKIGNSKGIILNKNILKYLDLELGDWIKGTIEKVQEEIKTEKKSN